jgi:hypothetical protein
MKRNETAPDVSKPGPSVNRLIPDFNLWSGGNGHLLESWARCNAAVLEGAVEVAQEVLAFSQARFQADLEAWTKLTACRNASDFLECQKRAAEKATAQYLEASKIASKMAEIVSRAAAQIGEQGTKA